MRRAMPSASLTLSLVLLAAVLITAVRGFEYRLMGGDTTFSGRLDVRPDSSVPWGYACHRGFTPAAARVACRAALAIEAAPAEFVPVSVVPPSSEISPSAVVYFNTPSHCEGGETALENCPTVHASSDLNCTQAHAVYLMCTPPRAPVSWQYRLTGANAANESRGLFELRPNASAPWGYLRRSGLRGDARRIACLSLGFPVSSSVETVRSVLDRATEGQPPYASIVACAGNETSIEECDWTPCADCAVQNALQLSCTPYVRPAEPDQFQFRFDDDSRFPGRGRISVLPAPVDRRHFENDGGDNSSWGYICDEGFGSRQGVRGSGHSAALCRYLGYSGIGAREIQLPATSSVANAANRHRRGYFRYPQCDPANTSLRLQDCASTYDSTYFCGFQWAIAVDCVSANYQYRFVPDSNNNNNSNSNSNSNITLEGLLEARANATAPWGKVCYDDEWTQATANAACGSVVGEGHRYAAWRAAALVPAAAATIKKLSCAVDGRLGTESCSFGVPASENETACTTAVYLTCSRPPVVSAADPFVLRLDPGPSPGRGVVLIAPAATASIGGSWGNVCGRGMSHRIAGLMCTAAGMPPVAQASWRTAIPEQGTAEGGRRYPILAGKTACLQSATNFSSCTVSVAEHTCTKADVVELDCNAAHAEFRLADGAASHSGRLEVRRNSSAAWGTVCNRGFGQAEATVACRSLGHPAGTVATLLPPAAALAGAPSQTVLYTSVRCQQAEPSLALCEVSTAARPQQCTHDADVSIVCGSASATAGCSGPTGCAEWVVVGRDVRPPCAAGETHRGDAAGTVSHTDCRFAAAAAATAGTGNATPSYVMAPDNSNCTVYACAFTSDTVLPIVEEDLRTGRRYALFAPVRAQAGAGSLGFCNRQVSCAGNGEAIQSNLTRIETCVVGRDTGCFPPPTPAPTAAPSTLAPSTPAPQLRHEFRLSDSTTDSAGRLEARPLSDDGVPWRGVCKNTFGDSEGRVACRSLGFADLVLQRRALSVGPNERVAFMTTACVGNETDLNACTFNTNVRLSDCNRVNRVWLFCSNVRLGQQGESNYTYRLKNSSNAVSASPWGILGRVEVRPNATAPWGAICSDQFTPTDAVVACRSLGWPYPSGNLSAAFRRVPTHLINSPNNGTVHPFYIDDIVCNGAERDLSRCSFRTEVREQCGADRQLALVCGLRPAVPPSSAAVRFVDENGTVINAFGAAIGGNIDPQAESPTGRPEYRPNASAPWGIICGGGLPPAFAMDFVCQSAGYQQESTRIFTSRIRRFNVTSNRYDYPEYLERPVPTYLGFLKCAGNESRVDECVHSAEPENNAVAAHGGECASVGSRALITCRDPLTSPPTTMTIAVPTSTPAPPTVAPTTEEPPQLGTREVKTQSCSCTCDDGYFGADCSAAATMSTAATFLRVRYEGAPLTFAERDAVAQAANAMFTDATVTANLTGGRNFGSFHEATLTATSATGDTASETAAALSLLQPANLALLTSAIKGLRTASSSSQPLLTLQEITMPSFALRGERALNDAVNASAPFVTPPLGSFGVVRAVAAGSIDERVTELRLALTGVRVTSPAAHVSVTDSAETFVSNCTPSGVNPNGGCAAEVSCTLPIPQISVESSLTIMFFGLEATCNTAVAAAASHASEHRQLLQQQQQQDQRPAASSNVTVLATTQARLEALPARTASVGTLTLTVRSSLFVGALTLLGVGGLIIIMNFLFMLARGDALIAVPTNLIALVGVGVYIWIGVAAYQAYTSGLDVRSFTFFDEYRGDQCTPSTSVPHRVSFVPADGGCHLMHAYGTPELPYYARSSGTSVAFGRTSAECRTAPFIPTGSGCFNESTYMPGKPASDQQYFTTGTLNVTDFEARRALVERALDPAAQPSELTATTALASSDRALQPTLDTAVITYFVGAWRTATARFRFDVDGARSSTALAMASDADIVAGSVGMPVEAVRSRGEAPPRIEPVHGTSPMAGFGPLFNGFGSPATAATDRYGAGAMRYHGVQGSLYDIGSLSPSKGFTFNFWMRATNASRGFAFLTTDAWMESDGVSPIATRLTTFMGNPSRAWFSETWSAYSAVFIDGPVGTVSLLYRNPDDVGGNANTLTWSTDRVIGDLFDGGWHFVAVTGKLQRGRFEAQIFVDGRTSYTHFDFRACLDVDGSFPAVRDLPPIVRVSNAEREVALQGGVAYVGHLNAGVFGFMVHERVLPQQVIASLGSPHMVATAAIAVDRSRVSAGVLLGIFALMLIVSAVQIIREVQETAAAAETEEDPEANTKAAGVAQGEGANAAANVHQQSRSAAVGSTAGTATAKLVVILPIFMTVCQSMTLYFQGWQWPLEFQLTFEWIYFPFSLDFVVVPSIPVWVTYGVQFAIAIAAVLFVFTLSDSDRHGFQQDVIDRIEDEGLFPSTTAAGGNDASLPMPDVDDVSTQLSVLPFNVEGHRVVGAYSRVAMQNAMTFALLNPGRPLPVPSNEPASDEAPADEEATVDGDAMPVTVLLDRQTGTDDNSGVPRYIAQLAATSKSLEDRLQLCGFTHIATLPSLRHNLLHVYDRLAPTYPELDVRADANMRAADKFGCTVDTVAAHYALVTSLFEIAPVVLKRAIRMFRAMQIDDAQEYGARQFGQDADGRKQFAQGVRQTKHTNFEKIVLGKYVPDGLGVLAIGFDEAEMERELADPSVHAATQSTTQRTAIAEARTAISERCFGCEVTAAQRSDGGGRTIMHAASEAGMRVAYIGDVDQEDDAAVARCRRETEVVAAIAFESPIAVAILTSLYYVMDPRSMAGYDDMHSKTKEELNLVADATYRLLVARLTAANFFTATLQERSRKAELASGFVRVELVASANYPGRQIPRWYFHEVLEAESPEKTSATKQRRIKPAKKAMTECPIHAHLLLPHIPEVHGRARERDPARVYRCAHRANLVAAACRDAELDEEQYTAPRKPCSETDYYVCSDDTCNFAVCKQCCDFGAVDKANAARMKALYLVRRQGLKPFIGLLMILAAQAMYMPAIKSAVSTVFCHSSLLCHFPDCYVPATFDFFLLSIASLAIIIVLGMGLFWFLLVQVYTRKKAILVSGVLEPHLVHTAGALCCEGEPVPFSSEGAYRVADTVNVAAPEYPGHKPFQALLKCDTSMFKGLYEQYEFKWMVVHPMTFLFKVMLLLAVLYAGEANSLPLIVGCSVVEVLQLLFYMVTNPFADPWLDVLQKSGSLHQVAQLGLMCAHRADSYEDPSDKRAAYAMIGSAVVYLLVVAAVLVFVVVLPTWRKKQEEKAREKAVAAEAEAEDNTIEKVQEEETATNSRDATSPTCVLHVSTQGCRDDGAAGRKEDHTVVAGSTAEAEEELRPPSRRVAAQKGTAYARLTNDTV